MKKSVTICFPTHNESGNIRKVLTECIRVMSGTGVKWTILAIDNCSTDGTQKILQEFSKRYRNIRYIEHERNIGYAGSTRTALKNATGDIIFIIDSDGQQTAKDIPAFIAKINEGYDAVVGWKIVRHDPPFRILLSKVYNLIFNILFWTSFHDIDCGFRALTKKAAKTITIEAMGVPVGAELFAKAKKNKLKIAELPVKHFPRKSGKSVFKPWKIPLDVMKIFISLIRLRIKLGSIN